MPMRAYGYVRVSSEKQKEQGSSLETQTKKIQAMSQLKDMDLLGIISDGGESAKTLERPGMKRLLTLVNMKQVEVVIVSKLDRLTRSVKDLGQLLETFDRRGISLVSVAESLDTQSAAGRLVINIMASVSQWEREAIGERTRDVLRHMKSKGERTGGIPYGFALADNKINLVESPREQEVLARIRELRRKGYSLRGIATDLNSIGLKTRRGTDWQFEYVRNVLKAA